MNISIRSKLYRFIFENSLDAIMLTSPDGLIYRANPAACTMFQRSEAEIIAGGRAALVDLNDPRLPRAIAERAKLGKVRAEIIYLRKDGSKFLGDASSALFTDDQGKIWTAMIIRDVSQVKEKEEGLRKANKEITQLAMLDYLTGVMNRRAFIENLQNEMNRASRYALTLSLLLIDLDYFKAINDEHGHLVGDLVLKKVACCLLEHIRPYDLLGRFGGDEFIICLPNTILSTANDIAERIRREIEVLRIQTETIELKLTSSIGVIIYSGQDNDTVDSLISRADTAMYRAKSNRNCVITL